jgi:hypothetical protein
VRRALALWRGDLSFHLSVVLAGADDGLVGALLVVADVERAEVGRAVGVVAQEQVVALAAEERVAAEVADQLVVAVAPLQRVVGGAAEELVGTVIAADDVGRSARGGGARADRHPNGFV